MVRQIILAGLVVFLPAGAQAQGRGGMPAVSHTVGVAPRVVMQAPHAGTAQAMPGTRTVTRGGAVRPRAAATAEHHAKALRWRGWWSSIGLQLGAGIGIRCGAPGGDVRIRDDGLAGARVSGALFLSHF